MLYDEVLANNVIFMVYYTIWQNNHNDNDNDNENDNDVDNDYANELLETKVTFCSYKIYFGILLAID